MISLKRLLIGSSLLRTIISTLSPLFFTGSKKSAFFFPVTI
ncbi:hypothetical protein MXB_5240 [Myxobolus squamalis]|nr:hypothetical protein MXB_5240 [Myxobolus squamalis]